MITADSEIPDPLDALEMPQVVRLDSGVVAACFSLMKLLPARHIINDALRTGRLTPSSRVIETTSGTFGLGLAMVCAQHGLPLTLVSDPVIDDAFRNKLEALGAEVEIVTEPAQVGGFQASRLSRLEELTRADPTAFIPRQYENPLNPDAYGRVADMLLTELGGIDFLVGCVGSGGSMCGLTRRARQFTDLMSVGIDTHGSVLFGMSDKPRLIRGLGNSLLPPNLDHSLFNQIHWLNAPETIAATHALFRDESLFRGPTSGAAALVANWIQLENPGKTVVVVMADEGERYLDTVFNPDWRAANGCSADTVPSAPINVRTPNEAEQLGTWAKLELRNEWTP